MIKIDFEPLEKIRWKITKYSVFLVKYCHLRLNTFFLYYNKPYLQYKPPKYKIK